MASGTAPKGLQPPKSSRNATARAGLVPAARPVSAPKKGTATTDYFCSVGGILGRGGCPDTAPAQPRCFGGRNDVYLLMADCRAGHGGLPFPVYPCVHGMFPHALPAFSSIFHQDDRRCHRRGSKSQHILGADACRFRQRCPKMAADFPAKLLNTPDISLQQPARSYSCCSWTYWR